MGATVADRGEAERGEGGVGDMRQVIPIMLVALALIAYGRATLGVKVIAVDHKERTIRVLLPAHGVEIEAELIPEESEIRVALREFYEATFEPGVISTTKRNVLRIDVPGGEPTRFRVQIIKFLR